MRRTTFRIVAGLFTIAALTTALPASATAAAAGTLQDCTGQTAHQDLTAAASQVHAGQPIRSGVYSYCSVRAWGPMWVYLDCWVQNTQGNFWWFVKQAPDGAKGWTYEGNLQGYPFKTFATLCKA